MNGKDEKGNYPLGNNHTDKRTERSTNCRECSGSKDSLFWVQNFLRVASVPQAHHVHLLTQVTILLFLRNSSWSYLLLMEQIQVYPIYSFSTITLKNLSAYWEAQHSGWVGHLFIVNTTVWFSAPFNWCLYDTPSQNVLPLEEQNVLSESMMNLG